jgi:hypothetical protein
MLPAKEKKLKAFAWVRAVLFSVNMARIVLGAQSTQMIMEKDAFKDVNNRAGKCPSKTLEKNHLPDPFTKSKHGRGNRHPT